MRHRLWVTTLVATLLGSTAWAGSPGEKFFNGTCAACHQKGGVGAPGVAPPLANKELWQRLGANASRYITGVMLFGMSGKLDGPDATLIMPPQDQLSDTQLAAIGTYVLKEINGVNAAVDKQAVTEQRGKSISHPELKALRK